MSDEVKRIRIQLRAPRGGRDGGLIEEGHYVVFEGAVVLTDERGKPVGDKRPIMPGEDAHLIACAMLRQRARSKRTGPLAFNRALAYPKMRY